RHVNLHLRVAILTPTSLPVLTAHSWLSSEPVPRDRALICAKQKERLRCSDLCWPEPQQPARGQRDRRHVEPQEDPEQHLSHPNRCSPELPRYEDARLDVRSSAIQRE